jgi:hypothetical protein
VRPNSSVLVLLHFQINGHGSIIPIAAILIFLSHNTVVIILIIFRFLSRDISNSSPLFTPPAGTNQWSPV